MPAFDDTEMENLVSLTLRWGVTVSSVFMLCGFILYATSITPLSPPHRLSFEQLLSLLTHDKNFLQRIAQPNIFFYFGIIGLTLTPILRVMIAVFSFLREKDWRYVFVSTTVLIILLLSISLSIR